MIVHNDFDTWCVTVALHCCDFCPADSASPLIIISLFYCVDMIARRITVVGVARSCKGWRRIVFLSLYCAHHTRSTQSWFGAMSTSDSWSVKRHTARCTSPVSVVLQCKLVSAWGLRKRRSAPPYGPWLRKCSTASVVYIVLCLFGCGHLGLWDSCGWGGVPTASVDGWERRLLMSSELKF